MNRNLKNIQKLGNALSFCNRLIVVFNNRYSTLVEKWIATHKLDPVDKLEQSFLHKELHKLSITHRRISKKYLQAIDSI